ncbi:inner centromere protein A isoform X1 [Kryptolebias marmoratus]|uniref:inner centromere protein A isoform X1 n=1 Tax=Kryptolebias marmoratus TaxID=37003 RepID=UPI0007F932E8|nr:inner centromere protein A isoform X1 [Kryptolebias marmoratus]
MTSVFSSVRSLMEMFHGKTQEFISEIDNVHMVWLEEIQQEANRMFSRDFNTEPELMPKTPSQKKKSRRKRVSLGRQEESQARRFSKGRRSNLRGSGVKPLDLVAEEEANPDASTSAASRTSRPKRATRKDKQTQPEVADGESQSSCDFSETEEVQVTKQMEEKVSDEIKPDATCGTSQPPPSVPSPEVTVRISAEERLSAEITKEAEVEASTGRAATKIAIAETTRSSRRSSGQCSLNLRHSLAGLRHSMTQESVRRASRRSVLKRKAARKSNSTCSSVTDEDIPMDTVNEEDGEIVPEVSPADFEDDDAPKTPKETSEKALQTKQSVVPCIERVTRSAAANSPKLAPPSLFSTELKVSTPVKKAAEKQQLSQAVRRSSRSTKRKAPDSVEDSPSKRFSPPMKSQSAIKPHMRSFLHTVQKNQMLMMTPNSSGRAGMIKSFIKHTTPLRVDHKINTGTVTKERHKLEALRKKQEQEEERMRKMEEEKKRKQEELKKKRDERIRRVFEAKVKEEQREVEKKKKIEQKMAQIDEKNEKRLAEEKTKKKLALKRQEELEQKRKLEEEAKKKKIQQVEEEKRQQELAAKKKAEEEEEQARRALELRREQERERQAAAERQRLEKEKALALQRELEKAAREKEMRDLEEKRKALEEKRKLEEQQRLAAKEQALKEREEAKQKEAAAAKQTSNLNVTVDIERSVISTPVGKGGGLNVTVDVASSPQSYAITPNGGNKTSKDLNDYGMDQNSDDSTDDESAPRKPIPSWAEGPNLKQLIMKQYFNPPDLDSFFGVIEPPRLEDIFYKNKPRYFKRTSSAVWHSPPSGAK